MTEFENIIRISARMRGYEIAESDLSDIITCCKGKSMDEAADFVCKMLDGLTPPRPRR